MTTRPTLALATLLLLAMGLCACPTTEPASGAGGDSDAGGTPDMRQLPDTSGDRGGLHPGDGGQDLSDDSAESDLDVGPDAAVDDLADDTVGADQGSDADLSGFPDVTDEQQTGGPSADFTFEPDPVVVGEPVSFDASSSSAGDTPIVVWDWAFGDTTHASGENVAHAFALAGNYDVELTVTDEGGLEDSLIQTVSVTPPANAPMVNAGADLIVLQNESFTVSGTATDSDGAVVAYEWDFGGGAVYSGDTATHTFTATGTYTAILRATDDDGNVGMDAIEIICHLPPTAVITVLTAAPTTDAPVAFSGLSSSDPDGHAITSYFWEFGDEATGTGSEPTHMYASTGTYDVTLTVSDELGATGQAMLPLIVDCVGDCGASGQWRVRPFDSEESASGDCNELIVVTVGPATCDMTEDGTSLTMDCGGGFVYSGTRSGDSFSLSLPLAVVPGDDAVCGDAYFSETISGSFVSGDRWEADSSLYVDFEWWDPFYCYDCLFPPFLKTGTRQ